MTSTVLRRSSVSRVIVPFVLLGIASIAMAREPSNRFQGYYRGYLEQYASADLPNDAHESIAVIGYVKRPGVLPPRERLTLTEAIRDCGGSAEFADRQHVGIWKDAEGRFAIANVRQIERKQSADPVLRKGDIVVVTVRWMTGF